MTAAATEAAEEPLEMQDGETGGSDKPTEHSPEMAAFLKQSSIPHVAQYIVRFVEMGNKSELIALTLTHAEVPIFLAELENIIRTLQRVGETYVPIGVVSNSVHIESEVLVVMRCVSQIHNFAATGWYSTDPADIASRYSVQIIQGPAGGAES